MHLSKLYGGYSLLEAFLMNASFGIGRSPTSLSHKGHMALSFQILIHYD